MIELILPIVAVSPGSIPISRHGFGIQTAHHSKVLTHTVHNIPVRNLSLHHHYITICIQIFNNVQ